jgi:hypothetical protein
MRRPRPVKKNYVRETGKLMFVRESPHTPATKMKMVSRMCRFGLARGF